TGIFLLSSMNGKAGKLCVESSVIWNDLVPGESIAVNGVCLTLEKFSGRMLEFHVMEETFRKTNLGSLRKGGKVNLERALAVGARLGGHIVSGHVDGCGNVLSLEMEGDDRVLRIGVTPELRQYMVPKGSIAVNGVSLTIAGLWEDSFSIHIIPTTWQETNLAFCRKGESVNLECDMLGKYVLSMLERLHGSSGTAGSPEKKNSSVNWETLIHAGFGTR
ncbi:MAG: riboflavin synthase, partial [Lentisphaeria bacterium]|nr:riboflavin synthase [Lentisphaeria bacterium]